MLIDNKHSTAIDAYPVDRYFLSDILGPLRTLRCIYVVYLRAMTTTLPAKDTNILIRIDTKLKAKLVKAATKDGRTLSDFIRRTLEEKISNT